MQDKCPTFHRPWAMQNAPGQPEHSMEIGVIAVECGNPDCEHQCRDVALLIFGSGSSLDFRFRADEALTLGNRLVEAAMCQLHGDRSKAH